MLIMYCEPCGKNAEYLSIKEASVAASITRRTVYYWISIGRLHLIENAGGHTLICRSSLFRSFSKQPPPVEPL